MTYIYVAEDHDTVDILLFPVEHWLICHLELIVMQAHDFNVLIFSAFLPQVIAVGGALTLLIGYQEEHGFIIIG